MYPHLTKHGFTESFAQEASMYANLFPARVCEQHRDLYKVICEQGELAASVSGKLLFNTEQKTDFPAVGDWVMIDRLDDKAGNAIIHHILKRKSAFTRKASGTANEEQIVAANIDTVFICMSLNENFNLRRIERYLTIAWDSKAKPVIVLTKSDLCDDLEQKIIEISSVSMGADVATSSVKGEGAYSAIEKYIESGKTIAFIGSSGVGKSTLINTLMGQEVLTVNEIREDDGRGRHTTTHRELLMLPNGGIVIDTPGMRELHLYSGDITKAFEDIEELSELCKYSDCSHTSEPGCKVQEAIENGILSEKRFENYVKLQREVEYEGLNSRQLENAKINRMFGSKKEMKQTMKYFKDKNKR